MRCETFRKKLARWLYSRWDIDAPEDIPLPDDLSRHAGECPECMKRLKTAVSLADAQANPVKPSPLLAGAVQERLIGRVPGGGRRTVLYSSVAAALAIILVAAGLLVGFPDKDHGADLLVKFSLLAPEADTVYVVGDWNNWNAGADPLFDEDSDGVWETEIKLEPGREYRYQFYIDDSRWVADPKTPLKIDDGFGGENSILKI